MSGVAFALIEQHPAPACGATGRVAALEVILWCPIRGLCEWEF